MKRLLLCVMTVLAAAMLTAGAESECPHWSERAVSIGDMHQWVCDDCGTVVSTEEHYALCSDVTTCSECGQTGLNVTEDYFYHDEISYRYLDDGVYHICETVCDVCSRVLHSESDLHSAYCNTVSTCHICELENIKLADDSQIIHGMNEYIDLGGQHQFSCAYCGVVEEVDDHLVWCDEPTVCSLCDASNLVVDKKDYSHRIREYVDLGDRHQSCCIYCDDKWEPNFHAVSCVDEDRVCIYCDAENVELAKIGHYHTVVVDQGTFHQGICEACGGVLFSGAHNVLCDSSFPTTCLWGGCEAVIDSADEAESYHGYDYVIDGDMHVLRCPDCGVEEKTKHLVECDRPDYCTECGADGLNVPEDELTHAGAINMEYTAAADSHSYMCVFCQKMVAQAHSYSEFCEGCLTCGYIPADNLPGDADNDDVVSVADVLAVLQRVADGSVSINELNADVNSDGVVDTADVLLILQYAAGWAVELK